MLKVSNVIHSHKRSQLLAYTQTLIVISRFAAIYISSSHRQTFLSLRELFFILKHETGNDGFKFN